MASEKWTISERGNNTEEVFQVNNPVLGIKLNLSTKGEAEALCGLLKLIKVVKNGK